MSKIERPEGYQHWSHKDQNDWCRLNAPEVFGHANGHFSSAEPLPLMPPTAAPSPYPLAALGPIWVRRPKRSPVASSARPPSPLRASWRLAPLLLSGSLTCTCRLAKHDR